MTETVEIANQRLQARIEHLEENRRFIQNALEMVLSMADFNIDIRADSGCNQLVQIAVERIQKIIPLKGCTVYQVDDQTAEFMPSFCSPASFKPVFKPQIEFMIEEGYFAWAIRERRGLYIDSQEHGAPFLLHVIANNAGVKGMFIGLLEKGRGAIPSSSLTLLSIALFNMATLMDSMNLYQMVKNQNLLLEEKVAQRTERLNRSKLELQKAMQHQEQLAQAAEQANRAKGLFLANMSHEIRTPLNGIIGCTEIMLKSERLDECHTLARTSLVESEHLLNLINNVLDYSKIEAGKIELERRPFNLVELVHSIIDGMRYQAEVKGLGLKSEFHGAPAANVSGDALRLRQILINLTNNAVKFTSKGSVTLSVEKMGEVTDPSGQTLRFSVIDTGIGIPKERQKAIFERFSQADESTTRRYGGTGLGTAIAYQLVELMGGRLRVESDAAHGSIFSFVIDMDVVDLKEEVSLSRAGGVATAKDAETGEVQPGHILVAEDTPVNQMVIRKYLEDGGHSVHLVENGREAVAACSSGKYDLVLMDVQMPEMDGLEATRRIKARWSPHEQIPILALTANTDLKTRDDCEAAGMDEVLTKPIRRAALMAGVNRWLSGHSAFPSDDRRMPAPCAEKVLPEKEDGVPPFDLETAIYEFGDREMVRDVVQQLIENVAMQIEEIQKAHGAGEVVLIQKRAHAIKGGAATAEAGHLAATAADLEDLCREGDSNRVAPTIEKLIGAYEALKQYTESVSW